jgi:hypothetical protein
MRRLLFVALLVLGDLPLVPLKGFRESRFGSDARDRVVANVQLALNALCPNFRLSAGVEGAGLELVAWKAYARPPALLAALVDGGHERVSG